METDKPKRNHFFAVKRKSSEELFYGEQKVKAKEDEKGTFIHEIHNNNIKKRSFQRENNVHSE